MGKALGVVFGGLIAFLMALVLLMAILTGSGGGAGAAGQLNNTNGLSSAVPEQYREALMKYGASCADISPALLAAQIEAESGWNPNAQSPVGAAGLTQFMPGTWLLYGTDGDGDGKADIRNGIDAIASQAKFMCALAAMLKGRPGLQGTLTELILAAYNAGPGAVLVARGIPPFKETRNYVERIIGLIPKYEGAITNSGSSGGWSDPLAAGTYVRGTPFHKYGPMWSWKGWHTGADYPAAAGVPILAAGPGVIEAIQSGGAYGNHVTIDHGVIDGQRIETLSAHMIAFQPGLKVGQPVKTGDRIGFVGATGNVTGPHLHLEVRVNFTNGDNDAEFTDPWVFIDSHRGAAGSALGQKVVEAARQWIGTPYSWGGGTKDGPSIGFGPGSQTVGFDCSGLVLAAVAEATGGATIMPRVTTTQVTQGTEVKPADRQPGDLIFFNVSGSGWDHVGIYAGNGQMIHAPSTGKNVALVNITTNYWKNLPQTTRRVVK